MQRRAFAILVAMLAAAAWCGDGWTRGGHSGSGRGGHAHSGSGGHAHRPHVRAFAGGAVFGPGYFYPPDYYYYYPRMYMDPYGAPGYIEQGVAAPASPADPGNWFYCPSSNSYYPYVQQCPEGWQQVPPQIPPG